ncbi:Bug family tripartite tricarboxylate transporter substrate binding protein [Amorphus sp. 3PC139-8]|uniref:Bug family tripartite tricarboxylate transporter substrate binding protein n=1 Tax=Amorphus sp. 3PC139-8 TaxID=2735676 RepID=UPI00345D44C4
MKLFRRTFLATAAAATLALGMAPTAQAQSNYPDKTVKLVVWAGTGGALDAYGRELARLLEEKAGWETTVENRPGGSGAVGVATIMAQPADGYHLLILTGTLTFGIAQGLIPFEIDDLRLLRAMQSEPSSLAVAEDSELTSVNDFVDYMKANPNGLRVGGHAPAGFHQYVLYQLMQEAGFESGWIPHDASGKVPLALLGDHIDAAFMTPSSGLSQVTSGDVKLLGITSEERSEYFPDLPTFGEQGFDIVDSVWRGVAVKAGTPDDVVAEIQSALDKVTASDEWKQFQENRKQNSPDLKEEAFTEMAKGQLEGQRQFLKDAGILE